MVEDWDKSLNDGTDELMEEQLSRNCTFLGNDKLAKVRESFVIVIGLGGVGSHAAHMLVRSGVARIRLIDFDQVTLSSLNRHAVATRSDVGTPKVIAMRKHLLEINPGAHIETCVELFDSASSKMLLAGSPSFVLDCIDNMETKADLIHYCTQNSIRIVSSMGAGAKADPFRIQIADISDTYEDSLARATRRALGKRGCTAPVPVVYSTERPGEVRLLPLDESKVDEADQYASLPTFRSRILPVLGTIPALFGTAMASYVLTELAGFKTNPLVIKNSMKAVSKIHSDVVKAEQRYKDSEYFYLNLY